MPLAVRLNAQLGRAMRARPLGRRALVA
ncbi:MAG: hypothetical protein RLZZ598_1708, partial [Pseudomonadota bacterium]